MSVKLDRYTHRDGRTLERRDRRSSYLLQDAGPGRRARVGRLINSSATDRSVGLESDGDVRDSGGRAAPATTNRLVSSHPQGSECSESVEWLEVGFGRVVLEVRQGKLRRAAAARSFAAGVAPFSCGLAGASRASEGESSAVVALSGVLSTSDHKTRPAAAAAISAAGTT